MSSMDEGDLTPSHLRNPSPPPELQDEAAMADVISGTGISKHWVYTVLLGLLQEVEKHAQGSADLDETEFGVNVSDAQQDELSTLWDISMNTEVAHFLMEPECNTVDILIPVIYRSRAPRINEICTGILGNLCCVPEICVTLSQNETFVNLMCALLSNVEFDALTLKEAVRSVLICLSNPAVKQQWLTAILDTPDILSLVLFVLKSAVDESLLRVTGELLDFLMDTVDELCEQWASPTLVDSVLVALKQIGHKKKEEIKSFLHVFQLLSTSQTGVESLVEHSEGVMRAMVHWLREVCDEDLLILDDHLQTMTCVVSVLSLLLSAVNPVAHYLSTKSTILKDILKVLEALYNIHQHHDDPAALPHCIIPPSHATRPRQHSKDSEHNTDSTCTQSVVSDNPTGDIGVSQTTHSDSVKNEGHGSSGSVEGPSRGEEREEEAERDRDHDVTAYTDGYRTLLEALQDYFRAFFKQLKLDEADRDGGDRRHHRSGGNPDFYSVLKTLDKCPHRHVGYLVSTIVYTIPECCTQGERGEEKGEEKGEADNTSAEGWEVVHHLQHLCKRLHLKRAASLLADAVKNVKLTAGGGS